MSPLLRLAPLILLTTLALSSLAQAQDYAYFSDVEYDHIYATSIDTLAASEVVEGYAGGTYQPENKINRAEFLKIVLLAAGHETGGTDCYTDVADQWFAEYICGATTLGIVSGYPDGSFGPEKNINFAEAAKIIANTFELELDESLNETWYEKYVKTLETLSAIPGTIQSFSQEITRGEMAELTVRTGDLYLGYLAGSTQTYETLQAFEAGERPQNEILWTYSSSEGPFYLYDGTTLTSMDSIFGVKPDPEKQNVAYFTSEETGYLTHIVDLETMEDITTLTVATTVPTDEQGAWYDEEDWGFFDWDTTGEKLSFTIMNQAADPTVMGYTINLATGTHTEFGIENGYYVCGGRCYAEKLHWSPDGTQLLTIGVEDYNNGLYSFLILNTDGEMVNEMDFGDIEMPYSYDWSTDGTQIEYTFYNDPLTYTLDIS